MIQAQETSQLFSLVQYTDAPWTLYYELGHTIAILGSLASGGTKHNDLLAEIWTYSLSMYNIFRGAKQKIKRTKLAIKIDIHHMKTMAFPTNVERTCMPNVPVKTPSKITPQHGTHSHGFGCHEYKPRHVPPFFKLQSVHL